LLDLAAKLERKAARAKRRAWHLKTEPQRGKAANARQGLSIYAVRNTQRTRVLDMAGLLPGSCAIDLVQELRSPLWWTMVLVIDRLQVPPSIAVALDCDRSICGFSLTLVLDVALPLTAAALPAPPMVDEVPVLLMELAPRPMVEADVPPAAALPAVPPVVLPPWEIFEPTVAALGAVCAMATELASA
jgi:hypothetical protein